MKTQIVQSNIMRRVYYAFAIRLATHSITTHLLLLAILGYALAKLVHVAAVYKTVAKIPVGELAPALVRIVGNADWLTLVVLGLAIFTALSLRIKIAFPRLVSRSYA